MAKLSEFITKAVTRMETAIFIHQESEFEQEAFTPEGRDRVGAFLGEFDEAAFNAGFDAAILRERGVVSPDRRKQHRKDRAAEYRKAGRA